MQDPVELESQAVSHMTWCWGQNYGLLQGRPVLFIAVSAASPYVIFTKN